MKYVILIPIYNDRESLKILIENINSEIKDLDHEISLVVINDASSQQIVDTYPNIENINSIEIINMKENRGHARCIASGLKYIFDKKEFDFVIPMDGDGEDRPEEIKNFIEFLLQFLYLDSRFSYHLLKLKHKRKDLVIKRKKI